MGISASDLILLKMQDLLTEMKNEKPNDRSARDRRWAVSITKFEEAIAVFLYHLTQEE